MKNKVRNEKQTRFNKFLIGALTCAVSVMPSLALSASASSAGDSEFSQFSFLPSKDAVDASVNCTEANKLNLPVYKWNPEHRARGAVIVVHGLMQNGESVSPLAQHLATQGFKTYTIDQRGHGFWHFSTKPGEKGYRINYKQTIEDVRNLARLIRHENPGLPLFCVGESAGAAVCVRSAATSPELFDGVILCGIGTKTAPLRWKWVIADLMRDSYRWDHMISMERYVDCYTSEDSRTVAETLSDPYCRPTLSAREVLRTVSLMRGMKKCVTKLPDNVPLLVIEGACDRTMDPKSAATFVALAKARSKRLIMVPNSGHVLIGTSYLKPVVTHSIDNFLNTQTKPAPHVEETIAVRP